MKRAISYRNSAGGTGSPPAGVLELPHGERHLRRKRLELANGDAVLVDLPEPAVLGDGSVLVLDDGSEILVRAAPEPLHAVTARDGLHLTELAWHLGNRHLSAQIETSRILILRDHVIRAMIEGLGGTVVDVVEPFAPVRGAYHDAHAHPPAHADEHHVHPHGHDHA